jgi:hypothetical protein
MMHKHWSRLMETLILLALLGLWLALQIWILPKLGIPT